MQLLKSFYKSTLCLFFIVALAACDSNSSLQAPAESVAVSDTTSSGTTLAEQSTPTTSIAQVNEQINYTVLENPIAVSTDDKIEVTELFWYGCSHCFALEPFIKSWLDEKPDNAEFVKVPAIFSSSWSFHGQAYYTMQALGVLDEANDAFFHQIHVLRKPINDLNTLALFLASYDKSEEEVTAAFNSFVVDNKLRNATNLTRQSSATGVPAILVDGKYLTSVSQAGGQAELFEVIDQLILKAATE